MFRVGKGALAGSRGVGSEGSIGFGMSGVASGLFARRLRPLGGCCGESNGTP